MRYHVTLEPALGGTPTVIDLDDSSSGALKVRIDGHPVAVDAEIVGTQLSVRVDGKIVDLTTEGALPDLRVSARGRRAEARVESERRRATDAAKKQTSTESEKVILSPMPGRVVKILVQKGDVVEPGQPVLVMEAMKMENEIRARSAGSVAEVHVATGAAVESNARLMTLT